MKDQFHDLADRHEKAYAAFLKMDRLEHPEPKKPGVFRHLPWIMIPFAIVALAGIVLSASRTAFVFYDIALAQFNNVVGLLPTAEAINAIIVVDLSFVIFRYVTILLHYQRTKEAKEISVWMGRGFGTSFGVALTANVYSSVQRLPMLQAVKPFLDLAMGLAVGISVPILAFISGDILGILWVNALEKREHSWEVYLQELNDFNEARERRWATRKKDYGLSIKANIEAVQPVKPVKFNEINKRERVSKQTLKALQWLEKHPGNLDTPSRELVGKIGVSHVTIYKAQQIMKGGNYLNGSAVQ